MSREIAAEVEGAQHENIIVEGKIWLRNVVYFSLLSIDISDTDRHGTIVEVHCHCTRNQAAGKNCDSCKDSHNCSVGHKQLVDAHKDRQKQAELSQCGNKPGPWHALVVKLVSWDNVVDLKQYSPPVSCTGLHCFLIASPNGACA